MKIFDHQIEIGLADTSPTERTVHPLVGSASPQWASCIAEGPTNRARSEVLMNRLGSHWESILIKLSSVPTRSLVP
jgi:hypothetical protein